MHHPEKDSLAYRKRPLNTLMRAGGLGLVISLERRGKLSLPTSQLARRISCFECKKFPHASSSLILLALRLLFSPSYVYQLTAILVPCNCSFFTNHSVATFRDDKNKLGLE